MQDQSIKTGQIPPESKPVLSVQSSFSVLPKFRQVRRPGTANLQQYKDQIIQATAAQAWLDGAGFIPCDRQAISVFGWLRGGGKMKRVYVAGPYSAGNVLDVLQNIGRGEELAARVFNMGLAPFTPWHDKSFCMTLFDEKFTVKQFYDFSMAWLEVSDAVVLVPGWEKSKGTISEVKRAKELGLPVFESVEELAYWAQVAS